MKTIVFIDTDEMRALREGHPVAVSLSGAEFLLAWRRDTPPAAQNGDAGLYGEVKQRLQALLPGRQENGRARHMPREDRPRFLAQLERLPRPDRSRMLRALQVLPSTVIRWRDAAH